MLISTLSPIFPPFSQFNIPPGAQVQQNFAVAGGSTLELTFAQFWSSRGPVNLTVHVAFHGVELSGGCSTSAAGVTVDGGAGMQRVMVRGCRRNFVPPICIIICLQLCDISFS